MYIFITFAVLPLAVNFVSTESTKEPPKDIPQKTTPKAPVNDATSSEPPGPKTRSVWANHPTSHVNNEPQEWSENDPKFKLLRPPQTLTKIAKTLSKGFDPYFNKNYFEPFERRPKPVTLVALRKNGFVSRHIVKYAATRSSEVAELQSPYNELGSFWQDDIGDA